MSGVEARAVMPHPVTPEERIVALESGMSDMRHDITEMRGDLAVMRSEVRDDISAMRDDLAKRPSWSVATLVAILLAACSGLGSALIVVLSTSGG